MTNSKIESRLESILAPTAGRRGVTSLHVLAAIAAAVLVVPTFAGLHASTRAQQSTDPKEERTEALQRLKQLALASIMYASDYDGQFPYVQQTASAGEVLQPYMKNHEILQSPTKGGKFLLNMNLAGVEMTTIEQPAKTPLWVEFLPDPKMKFGVAFADGHAKLIEPEAAAEIKKAAAHKFPRQSKTHPLPVDYLLPKKP